MSDRALVNRIPKLAPRDPGSLPGLRLRGVLRLRMLALPLFFVLAFAAMIVGISLADPNARLSSQEAVQAQGMVLGISRERCSSPMARVSYEFTTADGLILRGSDCLDDATLESGSPVVVTYLADDPAVNALRLERRPPTEALMPLVMLPFALLVFAPMFLPQLQRLFRDRATFKRGTLSEARVVFVKRPIDFAWPGLPNSAAQQVYLEANGASGPLEVIAECANEWVTAHLAPDAVVTVVHDGKAGGRAVLIDAHLR